MAEEYDLRAGDVVEARHKTDHTAFVKGVVAECYFSGSEGGIWLRSLGTFTLHSWSFKLLHRPWSMPQEDGYYIRDVPTPNPFRVFRRFVGEWTELTKQGHPIPEFEKEAEDQQWAFKKLVVEGDDE